MRGARQEEPAHAAEEEGDADLVEHAVGPVLVRLAVEAQRLRPTLSRPTAELGMPPPPVALDEPCARGEDRHARDLEPGREPGHAEPREHHAASCGSPSTHASPPSREYPGAERAAAPSLPRGRSCAARLARASQNPGGTGMRQHALFRKAHTVFTLAREAVQQFSR